MSQNIKNKCILFIPCIQNYNLATNIKIKSLHVVSL